MNEYKSTSSLISPTKIVHGPSTKKRRGTHKGDQLKCQGNNTKKKKRKFQLSWFVVWACQQSAALSRWFEYFMGKSGQVVPVTAADETLK